MYTVINEYTECYTQWTEFHSIKEAIAQAIKLNLSGSVARVFEGSEDNIGKRVFPSTGAFKYHQWS